MHTATGESSTPLKASERALGKARHAVLKGATPNGSMSRLDNPIIAKARDAAMDILTDPRYNALPKSELKQLARTHFSNVLNEAAESAVRTNPHMSASRSYMKAQDAYNKAHGIEPKTVKKSVRDLIEISSPTAERKGRGGVKMTKAEKEKEIARLEKQMREAAKMMEYEYAALLRDQIIELRGNGL